MAHLGVLQVFDHYPCISDNVRALDGQFRRYMEQLGWPLTRMTVVDARETLATPLPDCDVWIVSGTADLLSDAARIHLQSVLRTLARHRTVMALNGGEHLLFDTFAGPSAKPPRTPRMPRSVRNPFRSFWTRDRLYGLGAEGVHVLPRPEAEAGYFGFAHTAA